MKMIWELLPPFIKGFVAVVAFFISIGWASYGAVLLIVRAEGQEIEKRVMTIRGIDKEHFDERFNSIDVKLDTIQASITEMNKR